MATLIVEDQQKLATNIQKYLAGEHLNAIAVFDGRIGLEKALTETYELIILDINLPEIDGMSICKQLRAAGKNMPILMLTARSGSQNVIDGLNTGADDYMQKPFNLHELLARVRTLLRRTGSVRSPVLESGSLTLDTNTHMVTRNGKPIALAPREFALLEFLIRSKGIAQDRVRILEHVWGEFDSMMSSQTVDVHIAYLRKKIGKDAIQTIPGKGYMVPA